MPASAYNYMDDWLDWGRFASWACYFLCCVAAEERGIYMLEGRLLLGNDLLVLVYLIFLDFISCSFFIRRRSGSLALRGHIEFSTHHALKIHLQNISNQSTYIYKYLPTLNHKMYSSSTLLFVTAAIFSTISLVTATPMPCNDVRAFQSSYSFPSSYLSIFCTLNS